MSTDPPPRTAASVIARYAPRTASAPAADFARAVVLLASPHSVSRAKALLFAVVHLASYGELVGLELHASVLLSPGVLERFIRHTQATMTPATTLTLYTNLRSLAREVLGAPEALALTLSRTRARSPYRERELADYFALAHAQPTSARRARCLGLLTLGAGAGLTGQDLRHVCGTDVLYRSGGVVVRVRGARARVVPVLARYHQDLSVAAQFAGAQFIVGGDELTRPNVTTRLIDSLSGGQDLARLSVQRLRSTWLATVAQLIGLTSFMDAAGLSCSQHLGDVVANCSRASERHVVRTLGGAGE